MRHDPEHMPDILDTLAQLSSDEVPTPPRIAQEMLDLLPAEVWTDPTLRWLDPATKSGVFLREIAARLLVGLEPAIPDFVERREHIFRHMLFGTSITELTGHMARRSVYGSRNATSKYAYVRFADKHGNLPFVRTEHAFEGQGKSCTACGAPADLERGTERENYAYSFIHGTYPSKEMADMKFDVIVGNPPYQAGGKKNDEDRAAPLYHLFVEAAIEMAPRYVLMITPSRWFTGGYRLDSYRSKMIADRRISRIVDHPDSKDCFSGVDIPGGVSYFLWDREYEGDCLFDLSVGGKLIQSGLRDLRLGDGVVIRDAVANSVVSKVKRAHSGKWLSETISPRGPFGQKDLPTNMRDDEEAPFPGSLPVICRDRVGYVDEARPSRNREWIDQYKVLLPAAHGSPAYDTVVFGEPIAVAPGSVCTDTYLVAGAFRSRDEAENFAYYLASKFLRFLVLPRKTSQHLYNERFRFVPMLDMSRRWTDAELYEHFDLSDDEVAYVEQVVRPQTVNLSLDSPTPASHLPGGRKHRPRSARALGPKKATA